jgi:molybdate transport repressor ModE-like protein
MLDVTRLRVLAAVARHGSVTAAAKALNYAQPSVSHHLARLEAETGTRLVERSGRGVRLTDAGLLLAGRAEEILGRGRGRARTAPTSASARNASGW